MRNVYYTALFYAFFFLSFFGLMRWLRRFPDINMSAERLLSWQLYKNYVYNSETKSDNVSTSEDMFSFASEEEKNSSLRQLSNSHLVSYQQFPPSVSMF